MNKLLLAALCLGPVTQAHATTNLVENNGWKIDIGGFAEFDSTYDSRKSFTEVIGNTPVGRPNGENGRTAFSIRNSRFSVSVAAPAVDDWKTRAYLEMDFLGFDPEPGKVSGGPSEGGYFSSPTMRMRHGYLNAEKNGWFFLAGQTWDMLGWQPYYFVPTIQVSPLGGQLYSRTSQMRAMQTMDLASNMTLQIAAGAMRPPQRDGEYPSVDGGLRLAFNNRKGSFTGGATGTNKPQPMSIAISGTARNFEVPANPLLSTDGPASKTAGAFAVNAMIPVLASEDGKSEHNNLVIGGEFTMGKGYGDQFNGWTGNQNNPLNTAATAPDKNVNLDAGIGGFTPAGNFSLIQLQTFNVYAQYHLPTEMPTWISGGYTQLKSANMSGFAINKAGAVAYDKTQTIFGNISHDFTNEIRLGFEYARVTTSYVDAVKPIDNRYQLSTWYLF